jgi:hypothetical protein
MNEDILVSSLVLAKSGLNNEKVNLVISRERIFMERLILEGAR